MLRKVDVSNLDFVKKKKKLWKHWGEVEQNCLDVNTKIGGGLGELQKDACQSLTSVERACDESEQVLCELEDLTLASFPAAHLCSRVKGGCL